MATSNEYTVGQGQHFERGDAVLSARNHTNWRLQAIRGYENLSEINLNYTSVLTVSSDDAFRIKKLLLDCLAEKRAILRTTKDEKIFSLMVDFFEI